MLPCQPGSVRDLPGSVRDLTGAIPDLPGSVLDLSGAIPDLPGSIRDLKFVKNEVNLVVFRTSKLEVWNGARSTWQCWGPHISRSEILPGRPGSIPDLSMAVFRTSVEGSIEQLIQTALLVKSGSSFDKSNISA